MWPDYMKRETLARRLDLAPGAVDQYVKRGLLPMPHKIGEAQLWCWSEVDNWLRGVTPDVASATSSDPYLAGLGNGQKSGSRSTAARPQS